MIFTEFRFIIFFMIVFAVHWLLIGTRSRKLWLLSCSYFIYAAWDWRFLSLILLSTVVDYCVALALERKSSSPKVRKRLLITSVVFNLGMLGVFKYFNFFQESAVALLTSVGFSPHPTTLQIILPVGISFYTFQTMSYTIDVYREKLQARKSLLDVALFVGFFPQLVAGPIVRAIDFLPQLQSQRTFSKVAWRGCITLFLLGFIKKACVSDNISIYIDQYFSDPQAFESLSAVLAVSLYSVQIYCDFSGYSDMAIATAGMLGYQFCDNFSFPYFATNIQDFWRRWHISLSTWLRDYLYIPLGGSRGSKLFHYRNLLLTMLLGGLWHGAAWRFVVWGALHGVALIAHREFDQNISRRLRDNFVWKFISMVVTFYWVGLAWIFFRAADMQDAIFVSKAYMGLGWLSGAEAASLSSKLWVVLAVLLAGHLIAYSGIIEKAVKKSPRWAFAAAVGVTVAVITSMIATEIKPFIYFQF